MTENKDKKICGRETKDIPTGKGVAEIHSSGEINGCPTFSKI